MADTIRTKPIVISKEEDLQFLNSLVDTDIHQDSLKEMFGNTEKYSARFLPTDKYKISLSKFQRMVDPLNINKTKDEYILTTVGRYIFNIFMNNHKDPYFFKICGYLNNPLTIKEIDNFSEKMSNALLMDVITKNQYIDFLNRREWIGYNMVYYMTPTINLSMLEPNKKVIAKREALIKKYEKELNNPEEALIKALEIEKELLAYAREILKDETAMDIYKSGARGSFENNYKNTAVMRGVLLKYDDNTKFKISLKGLSEGIPKEDIVFYNDLFVIGTAGRAKDTQKGGYLSKQLSADFQNLVLDEPGTDCKTDKYIDILIDKPSEFLLRYIKEGDTLKLLTPDILESYKGKVVKMRSPLYCKSKMICSKCAGELYYKLEIRNIGLITNIIGTSILNLSMKLFHDTTVKSTEIDIDKFID